MKTQILLTSAKVATKSQIYFQICLNSLYICLIPMDFELNTLKIRTTFTDYADSKLYKSIFIRIEQYETGTSPNRPLIRSIQFALAIS